MQITQLGEFNLIERFKKLIKTDTSVIKGSGDDCAVLKFSKNEYLLFTCDMLVEGVDFLAKENPFLIGRKAIAVSVSDIAACAGIPRYCLVALGLPKKTALNFVDGLFKGMRSLARKFSINLVGGDLSRAGRLVIDVSMLGVVEKKNLVLRNRAKKGDIIFVSGSLGGSIRGRHLKFMPRIKEARYLVKNFKINAMIDISDGLAQDLNHILEESKQGAIIYEKLIPLSRQAQGLAEALYMGEDFELLFTVSQYDAKRILNRGLADFKPIGEIVERKYGLRLVDKHSRERRIPIKGFRHF